MKKACIVCLLCSVFMVRGFAQSIEYFSTFNSNEVLETGIVPYDVVSIDSSRFIVAANSTDGTKACFLSIDEAGNIQLSSTITEEGHHIHLIKMFLSDDDKIVAFAIDKADGDVNSSLMTIHLDAELNIVYQHTEPVVFPNNYINVFCIEKIEDTYIAAFITGSFNTEFFTAKIDEEGHIAAYAQYDDFDTHYINSIFKVNDDSGMFGISAMSNSTKGVVCTIYVFDASLAVVSTKQVPSFEFLVSGEVSFCSLSPTMSRNTMLPLPRYDRYVVSSSMSVSTTIVDDVEYPETSFDKCTTIKKFDENFEMDTINILAIGWRNDTVETTARFRSLDGIYDETTQKERLYQCTKVNHLDFTDQKYPSHIVVVQCDENLNIGWHKRYFNDEIGMCYDPSTINATLDGGCLVVGTVHNIDSTDVSRVFALKIRDKSFSIKEKKSKMANITPNPAIGKVSIVLSEDKTIRKVEILNMLGIVVLEGNDMRGNTLDVSALPSGVYIVRIVTNDGKQEFAKLVKR